MLAGDKAGGCATRRKETRHGKPRKGCVRVNVVLPEPMVRDLKDMGVIFNLPVSRILEQAAEDWLRNQLAEGILAILRAETDEEAAEAEERVKVLIEKTDPCGEHAPRPLSIPEEILDGVDKLLWPQLLDLAYYAIRRAWVLRIP